MTTAEKKKERAKELRTLAENALPFVAAPPTRPVEELLHELQVHEIELRMQNDSLQEALSALEGSHARDADPYEFAPVGYFTLDTHSLIKELNLTAATLLGAVRADLLHRSFRMLVLAADRPRWAALFMRVTAGGAGGNMELTMRRGDGTFPAHLHMAKHVVGAGDAAIRVALTDISPRTVAEAALKQIDDFERFNRAAIDRELAMIGLKRKVNALSRELGRAPPFALDFADLPGAAEQQ